MAGARVADFSPRSPDLPDAVQAPDVIPLLPSARGAALEWRGLLFRVVSPVPAATTVHESYTKQDQLEPDSSVRLLLYPEQGRLLMEEIAARTGLPAPVC